jgi:hypothetical protein
MIFVILSLAAEGFMLCCLFHFEQELRQEFRRESAADLWISSVKPKVVPLRFIRDTQIVVWSEGVWGHCADLELLETRSAGAKEEHYDAAA